MYNHPYISESSVDFFELTFKDLKEIEHIISSRYSTTNHIKNNKLLAKNYR